MAYIQTEDVPVTSLTTKLRIRKILLIVIKNISLVLCS